MANVSEKAIKGSYIFIDARVRRNCVGLGEILYDQVDRRKHTDELFESKAKLADLNNSV